ncbi:sulfite exporter TauE/SafE family protein [Undibacterium sp. LX40W]|uniref:Sulfite exporter TauE/SafE family protein n=1 Tax=Undibacterium nitidum TaxID=2762298 RepID=A0A923HM74_9BURK|nr:MULTISPECIES: sulfite exporter TauE/SafE family protein [Undibacterium]MBC3880208.1 sulfite exporter TauE/SafE family protein [Undibacterium nitidum]MBC3891056.1 sulfite exporter TauE/SafE family protein [Undibacterium sp. LX40W]
MLTWPMLFAVISAGLIGGFHCVGMCGGISHLLAKLPSFPSEKSAVQLTAQHIIPIQAHRSPNPSKQIAYLVFLHAGRITTYCLIGAVFGGVGAVTMSWTWMRGATPYLFFFANILLLLLGLRLVGVSLPWPRSGNRIFASISQALMPSMRKGSRHPILLGLAWGALPCGLTYAVAPFAILSGQAWSGAILMLIFGLAALPHLLVTQLVSQQIRASAVTYVLRIVVGLVLIGLAILGLVFYDMQSMPAFLCITPVRP